MKTSSEISPGIKTTYQCPPSPLNRFAKVAGVLTALTAQDGLSVTFGSAPVAGAAVDIYYGNDIVVPPATRTASFQSLPMLPPPNGVALTLFLAVTAASGTAPTLSAQVEVLDPISGLWFAVLGAVFATVTATGNATLTIFPGATPTANASVNQSVRNQYRVNCTIGGTTPSFTFSIGSQA